MATSGFIQAPPKLENQFITDAWLKGFLEWRLPKDAWDHVQKDLARLGERVVGDMLDWAWEAETHPPVHVPYDPWGHRIDEIKMSPAWAKMAAVAAEEGLVAIGYERPLKEFSRLYQFAKLYLYHPSSAVFSCPLAMSDGAARILELMGPGELQQTALAALISRDPKKAWTSGQWMTEKIGGSDVSESETVAKAAGPGYVLTGTKWFTSSVTSEMALTLARIEGAPAGSKGLSMFFVQTHRPDGSLNSIKVIRLKDKLGTRALPTAELSLENTPARLIGEMGQGVKSITTMLNVTRVYNAICSVAQMRRALALWQSYASQRKVFGQPMAKQPLFAETFADEQSHFLANCCLVFSVAELMGRDECGVASDSDKNMLRLLTPLAKLFSGKHSLWTVSEALEGFGGAGYVEDTRIPVLLRDAQVFPIWEGPTNVLSLDMLRVLQKSEVAEDFFKSIGEGLAGIKNAEAVKLSGLGKERMRSLLAAVQTMTSGSQESAQGQARKLAFGFCELYSGVQLLRWADWALVNNSSLGQGLLEAVRRWWQPTTVRSFDLNSEGQASRLWL